MLKSRMILCGMIAVMSLGAATSCSAKSSKATADLDTKIIVEATKSLEGLSEEEILSSQGALLSRIRSIATNNLKVEHHYTVLNNAFLLSVNSNDIDAIKNVPGVKSVTIDKNHYYQKDAQSISVSFTSQNKAIEENVSATTMGKTNDVVTNDGEGTAIAVIDNEFYLKGKTATEGAWCHEAFTDLEPDVVKRYTYDNLTDLIRKTSIKRRKSNTNPGDEGSLYFNSKVPFYYDYGGTARFYGEEGTKDYDVVSKLAYHGSHVSSIAAANAPTYKGIAPKAQLVLMKVFIDYTADKTGKNLGLQNANYTRDSIILTALEDAIALGVDGMNMSLGSAINDFDSNSITLLTLSKLCNSNILSSISAGNDGKFSYSALGGYGNWSLQHVETGVLGSFSNNKNAMVVASAQPDQIYYEHGLQIGDRSVAYDDQIVNREGVDADYLIEHKLEELDGLVDNLVYVPGFGTTTDFDSVQELIDQAGKYIAVVNRGSTNFSDKYKNAYDYGAKGLIIINNDPTANDFNFRCDFGDDKPTIPCAIVLFKDKSIFENNPLTKFEFLTKKVSNNIEKRTISTYSSDGATYDLDLKPDITTPGDNVRGAVPPQEKDDRIQTPLSTYQYLSGTSMSAPNYAGAQSVLLSKVAKDVYKDGKATEQEMEKLNAFRKTIDMRYMSTAIPMVDFNANPEDGKKVFTSPRMQGAGLVNIAKAYSTDVYLEGLDEEGKGIEKSKVLLKNNKDIAKGNINISFLAHNESNVDKTYDLKLTVMRPAITKTNDMVSKDYNYRGEVDTIKRIPGITYYDGSSIVTSDGTASYKDVIYVNKDVIYYTNKADFDAHTNPVTIAKGKYYCSSQIKESKTGIVWDPLPTHDYQSIQDVVIGSFSGQTVTVKANGTTTINVQQFSIPEDRKTEILKYYQNGCMIEGFVELISRDSDVDLSIPYLGFYSGSDKNESMSYESAPVFEPFDFEKSKSEIYPSDLVNDLGKQLLGKDKINYESMWMVGYAKSTFDIDTSKISTNDESFSNLNGFHHIGINPLTNEYYENVKDNLYVGSSEKTNTMIIQQYMLRSVLDNYFTITNKETGEVVYKSALKDLIYGDTGNLHTLYKSHVLSNFLGAGYIAPRAYAIIPLYNTETGKPFDSGNYEVKFNYLLAATNSWVAKSYNIIVDSTAPEVVGIKEYKDSNGVSRIRIDVKDNNLCRAVLGYSYVDINYDNNTNTYFIDVEKSVVDEAIFDIGTSSTGAPRLFVSFMDKAYSTTGAIIHFDDKDYNKYVIAQGTNLKVNIDFISSSEKLSFLEIDNEGGESVITLTGVTVANQNTINGNVPTTSNTGLIIGLCIGAAAIVAVGIVLLFVFLPKRKNKEETK